MAKKVSKKVAARTTSVPRTLSADDIWALSDAFEDVADALREWRRANAEYLEDEEILHLRSLQLTILNAASWLTTLGVDVVLDEAAVSLEQLSAATAKARDAVETIESTKKIVEIAAATASLAGAVLAKDIGGAAKAAAALFTLVTEATGADE